MMLRAGLGWGNLPEHLVREDLRARRLVTFEHAAWGADDFKLSLSAIYLRSTMFGPAHRWLLMRLGTLCARDASASSKAKAKAKAKRR